MLAEQASENVRQECRDETHGLRGTSADRASVVTFSIEFRLNTDVRAFSQKTETSVIQRADGELVHALVGIVGQGHDTRAQVHATIRP